MGSAFRDISRDIGEAFQRAVATADLRVHNARPEPRAVLSNTPALLLVPPTASRLLQHEARMAGAVVFGGRERRQRPPDDLGAGVAFQPLGAGIPRCYVALQVQHEDRIISYTLDQRTKAF